MPIQYAPPCLICGGRYVAGTETLCKECLAGRRKRSLRRKRGRLRCDCGRPAVTVVLVYVGLPEQGLSAERMALCPDCLEVEIVTQAMLDERN